VFIAVIPYLGGVAPAAAAMAAVGVANGFANVVMIMAFQRWAPRELLGRLADLMTLASLGIFPVLVALAALVVHDFGPAPFFPLASAALAAAILAGLSQRAWRGFGMAEQPAAGTGPRPAAAGARGRQAGPGRRADRG